MKNAELARQSQKLKALIKAATESTEDLYLRSHWARYFSVLLSGYLEHAIYELYAEYVNRVASPSVARYAADQLAKINNPNCDKFLNTAGSFDPAWATALDAFIQDAGRKEAIEGIMRVRHQVAHGGNLGITIAQFSDYMKRIDEVIEFIETQVRP
jgi:hypothetical protein